MILLTLLGNVQLGIAAIAVSVVLYIICDWWLHKTMVSGGPTGRWVLITGCDSGFGRRAAERFDAVGCRVIATCLTSQGADNLHQVCSSRLTAVQMDVTDDGSIQHAFAVIAELLQLDEALWGIVNNVGVPGSIGPLEWLTQADIIKLFNVNVFGMCRVVRTFLPLMQRGNGGRRIVNMASILGRLNIPFAATYCMTKAAVESYSDALRIELHPYNIQVAIIEPGGHTTNFLDSIRQCITSAWNQLPEETQQKFGTDYLQQMIFLGCKLIPFIGSSNIDAVVDAYFHATFAERPRRRYLVGLDATLLQFATLLPSSVLDAVLLLPMFRAVPASCRRRR